jgi:hypothetical protein
MSTFTEIHRNNLREGLDKITGASMFCPQEFVPGLQDDDDFDAGGLLLLTDHGLIATQHWSYLNNDAVEEQNKRDRKVTVVLENQGSAVAPE